jgi:hypothetical protein
LARKRQAIRCKAVKADGSPCGCYAISGGDLCAWHGGRRKAVKRAAVERVVTAQAVELAGRYVPGSVGASVDVPAALAAIIVELRSFAGFMGERLAEFTADEWRYDHPDRPAILAEVKLYQRALDQAGRILVDVGRLGIEAAITSQAAHLERGRAESVVRAFDAATAGLPAEQRHQLAVVFAAILLTGGPPG